jgi:hypothetical protein
MKNHKDISEMDEQELLQTMRRVFPDTSLAEVREMIANDEFQTRVKAEFGDFYFSVSALLYRHDPEGLYSCASHGRDYDSVAGKIISRLRDCDSTEAVGRVVHEEFARWFGNQVKPAESFTKIAAELLEIWRQRENVKPAA